MADRTAVRALVVAMMRGSSRGAKERRKVECGIFRQTEGTSAKVLCLEGPVPQNAEIDAYHIAVATVNGMDYLLTWNCTHIANAALRPKLEEVCYEHDYELPVICTPQELLED